MNPLIKEQLDRCKVCKLPEYDDSTTSLIINILNMMSADSAIELQSNHYYIIKVAQYIINPPENFNLASNWNQGKNAQSEYLLVTPTKTVGKMTQFDGCGWDNTRKVAKSDIYSNFWLPRKSFEIIEEVQT